MRLKISAILAFLIPMVGLGALSEQDRAFLTLRNTLINPGFEFAKSGWTASGGTFSITTTAANVGTGNSAASWDSNAAAQTFTSSSVTIPPGFYGSNAVLRCRIQTPSGTATHTIGLWDGTTLTNTQTVTSSTSYISTTVNFVMPSSGTAAIRITSIASNEPNINVDDCYLGLSDNVGTSAQALFIGSAFFATTASCSWSRTSSTLGAFSTTAACPGPTVEFNVGPGTIQTTDTDLPRVTLNNLPPGEYEVIFSGRVETSSAGSQDLSISDGITTSGRSSMAVTTAVNPAFNVMGHFSYSTSGNRTFDLYGSDNTATVTINNQNANHRTYFRIYRYPSSTEAAFRPDIGPLSWSGYHDSTCTFSTTSASYSDPTADASCAFTERQNRNFGTVTSYLSAGNKLPGIVFTPTRSGRYFIVATPSTYNSSADKTTMLEMSDTSGPNIIAETEGHSAATNAPTVQTTAGIYNAQAGTSITIRLRMKTNGGTFSIGGGNGNAIEWTIMAIDQNFSAPVLVGSVTSNSSGAERLERASVTNSGTPAVGSQSGSWISSVTDNGTGDTTLNIASGIYAAAPACTCSTYSTNATDTCKISSSSAISSTLVRVLTSRETAGVSAATDIDFFIVCMGQR